MAIKQSGPLAASEINTELGVASGAEFKLGGSVARDLADVASGPISFSDFYGKSLGWLPADYLYTGDIGLGFVTGPIGVPESYTEMWACSTADDIQVGNYVADTSALLAYYTTQDQAGIGGYVNYHYELWLDIRGLSADGKRIEPTTNTDLMEAQVVLDGVSYDLDFISYPNPSNIRTAWRLYGPAAQTAFDYMVANDGGTAPVQVRWPNA